MLPLDDEHEDAMILHDAIETAAKALQRAVELATEVVAKGYRPATFNHARPPTRHTVSSLQAVTMSAESVLSQLYIDGVADHWVTLAWQAVDTLSEVTNGLSVLADKVHP